MRVTVVRPAELGPSEASLWARFQKSSTELQSPFFSLTFAQIVGRHRVNSRVAVVEIDGVIQAFLPYELGPHGIAMPIGEPMNNLQGFISGDAAIDARQVIRKAGLRGWRYTAAPLTQPVLAQHHYQWMVVQAPFIDLRDGYESYFASRSKKFTTDFGKQWRSLARRVGPVSLDWEIGRPTHVPQLIDWKSAKYGGARDLFAEPAARRIVTELAASSGEDCSGLVNVLRAGERIVAVSFNLTCPGVLCGCLTGYDPEMGMFSPGKLALLATAEEAARRDIKRFELGAGQDSYKSRVANASYAAAGGVVWGIPGERTARRIYRRIFLDREPRRQAAQPSK